MEVKEYNSFINNTEKATNKTINYINDTVEKTQDTVRKIRELVCSVLALIALIAGLSYSISDEYKTTFVNSITNTYTNIYKSIAPKKYYYNIYIKAVENHEQQVCPIHNISYNIDIDDFNIYQIENSDGVTNEYIVYLKGDGSCTAIIKSDNTVEFECEKIYT